MQYEPRQSSAPPSPIEPTGFFTGIQIRPIIIGVVIDTISTMLLTTLYYVGYVAKDLAGQGAPAEDAFSIYWSSSEGLVASLLLGSLGTLIGGCYAAYKAGKLHMKHGALVGMDEINSPKWKVATFEHYNIISPHKTPKGAPSFTAGNSGWMGGHEHWLPNLRPGR